MRDFLCTQGTDVKVRVSNFRIGYISRYLPKNLCESDLKLKMSLKLQVGGRDH